MELMKENLLILSATVLINRYRQIYDIIYYLTFKGVQNVRCK